MDAENRGIFETPKIDPLLEGMSQLAVPLDEWCDFCGLKLAAMVSADGVHACHECAKGIRKSYEDSTAAMAVGNDRSSPGTPNRQQRRAAAKRAKKSRKANRRGR